MSMEDEPSEEEESEEEYDYCETIPSARHIAERAYLEEHDNSPEKLIIKIPLRVMQERMTETKSTDEPKEDYASEELPSSPMGDTENGQTESSTVITLPPGIVRSASQTAPADTSTESPQ